MKERDQADVGLRAGELFRDFVQSSVAGIADCLCVNLLLSYTSRSD